MVNEIMKYRDQMIRSLRRYGRDQSWCEDMFNDAIVKAMEYKLPVMSVKTWFRRVMHNGAINNLRRDRYEELLPNMSVVDPRLSFDLEGFETILTQHLKGQQLRVVWMVMIECMTMVEISQQTGWNYDTVKANYRHGWLKVRGILREWYV